MLALAAVLVLVVALAGPELEVVVVREAVVVVLGETVATVGCPAAPQPVVAQAEDAVLALVELENVQKLMPSDLSGGMRKRVALARAIAMAPRAILYDEPTTGLDPITSHTINELIRNLQRRLGVSSIVVTHDIQSAFSVGDRIAFLHEGKITFDGTVEEARQTAEPLLRRFLQGGGYG